MFVPLDDGNAFVEYVDDKRTGAGLREIGVSDTDVAGFLDYHETFDRARRKLRERRRATPGSATRRRGPSSRRCWASRS